MTFSIDRLSQSLEQINRNADFSGVQRAAQQAANEFRAATQTTLGAVAGEVQGGIQALSEEIDDQEFAGVAQDLQTIARATENIPGIADRLIRDVQFGSQIEAITGTATAATSGFLQDIVTAANPRAVQSALQSAVGAPLQELQGALQSLTTADLQNFVVQALNIPILQQFQQFQSQLDIFVNQMNTTINSISGQVAVDLGESISRNFENRVVGLTDRTPPRQVIEEAFRRTVDGDRDGAFEQIRPYVDVPENYEETVRTQPPSEWSDEILEADRRLGEAQGEFGQIGTQLTDYSSIFTDDAGPAGTNSRAAPLIGQDRAGGRVGRSASGATWDFSDYASLDELEAAFRNINRAPGREVAGMIVHWTANFLDQNVGSEWVHDVHRNNGWEGIGYHIVIRRDGTIQRGRPMNRSGAHAVNFNTNFLGVSFVAGYNVTSREATRPYWRYNSSASITNLQWQAYDGMMRTFYRVFPYGQVNGHYIERSGKEDPGFDVAGYSAARFGRQNVIPDNDPIWRQRNVINIDTIRRYGGNV